MSRIDESVAKGIAGVSLWSSRNAKVIVGIVLVLTLGLGYGVTLIDTNVDVADVLPRGNHNTEAAHNLTDHFKSTFTQQVTWQLHATTQKVWEDNNALLPYRLTDDFGQADSQNITDEVYIRAMEELKNFIQGHGPFEGKGAAPDFERTISIANIYALIAWTEAGGEGVATPDDFALPGYEDPAEAQNYVLVDRATQAAVLDAVDTLASPSWNHAAMLFMPSATNEKDMKDLGQSMIDAVDLYIAAVDACLAEGGAHVENNAVIPCSNGITWTVWSSENPPLLTVDLPVANAHSSQLVQQDMVRLLPIIAAFIIVCLYIAFRNVRAIAISFTTLGVGVVWTYGIMGYMGIALNTLNMTIVPLIMGVGIDYSIHMINEFLEHKAHGRTNAEAFREAGGRAGLAMFIATMTTALGLGIMMISPSLLMAQLGFLSAVAITAIYALTITFIPAALTLLGGTEGMGQSFTPSKFMPGLTRGITKLRWVSAIAVIGLSIGLYLSSTTLEEEAFGDPGKNFPEDDPIRMNHEQGLAYFYETAGDIKTNILTFEGDGVLTPENVEYMRKIEQNLAGQDRVIDDTLRTLMFFIETWQTVKGGAHCAVVNIGSGDAPGILDPLLGAYSSIPVPCSDSVTFPDTEEEIRAEVDSMFASPMRELASIIVNHPDNDIVAMTFGVEAETYDDAAEVWDQVWTAIHAAGPAPEGVTVSYVGNTATNYLFVAEQLPWLTYMGVASTVILFALVLLFTGDIKATIIATITAGATSIWWLGILPFMNIGLAVTLMLPVVFIFNIGTDYVVHLIWNMKKVGDVREVWETTGKAILFSAITTAGSFAVFMWLQNVAVSRTMAATTVSIGVIFAATLMILPIFYKTLRKGQVQESKKTPPATPSNQGKTVQAAKRAKPTHAAVKRPKEHSDG